MVCCQRSYLGVSMVGFFRSSSFGHWRPWGFTLWLTGPVMSGVLGGGTGPLRTNCSRGASGFASCADTLATTESWTTSLGALFTFLVAILSCSFQRGECISSQWWYCWSYVILEAMDGVHCSFNDRCGRGVSIFILHIAFWLTTAEWCQNHPSGRTDFGGSGSQSSTRTCSCTSSWMCPAFVSQDWSCDSWETGLHLPLAEVPLCFGQDFCNASWCQSTCILWQKAIRIGLSTTGAPGSWFDDWDNWMFHCPKSDSLWSQSLAKNRSSILKSIGFCMSSQHLLWWTWGSTLWFVIGIPGSVVVQSILLYWYAFTHPLIQSASSQTSMACHLWSLHDISLDFGWRCCKFGGRFETLYAGYLGGQGSWVKSEKHQHAMGSLWGNCWIVVGNQRILGQQIWE